MKAEILYFDGCPTYERMEQSLRAVLAAQGIDAEVVLVAVDTDEDARRLKFPGSPTLRVDGEDLFPVPDRGTWALGCRTYPTPDGLRGWPTAEMIEEALTKKGYNDADGRL